MHHRIRITTHLKATVHALSPGDCITVDAATAESWIHSGWATQETQAEAPPPISAAVTLDVQPLDLRSILTYGAS